MGYTGVTGEYQMFESGRYENAPSLVVDRTWWRSDLAHDGQGDGTGSLRAFAGSKHQACDLVEVRANLEYDAATDEWSVSGTPEWLSMVRVPYHAEQAVGRDLMVGTAALVADPYSEGVFYGGVIATSCGPCDTSVSPQRPYFLQRKSQLLSHNQDVTTAWVWKRMGITDLQQPWTGDMAWGAAGPGEEVDRVYLGAFWGGMWEGVLGW